MKIITTSDWHLGNLFHGNDRLPEHQHFLSWLLEQIEKEQPDALLVAGDVFDNGNPSAAAQATYYKFLADATRSCPDMQVIITAGNHDSANRLEAPRALLTYHNVEIRGSVHRTWNSKEKKWCNDYDDLMIPISGKGGSSAVVLAIPFLRSDIVQNASYSQGVNTFLKELTTRAREKFADKKLIMMAHMYAKGAEIASKDASEKIVIGGQEEVNMEGWDKHPDYLTCGHIHKRQHIWNTDWARYTGSILPMSFAEINYKHGVDLVTFNEGETKPSIDFLEYTPQHKLRILPENDDELTMAKLKKLINTELTDKTDDDTFKNEFVYLTLKVKMDKVSNDEIKTLESLINHKNAVLCKIQKIIPTLNVTAISGEQTFLSIDEILDRNPLDTLKETFEIQNRKQMSEHQEALLKELLNSFNEKQENA